MIASSPEGWRVLEKYINQAFQILNGPFGWMLIVGFVIVLIVIVRGPSNPRP